MPLARKNVAEPLTFRAATATDIGPRRQSNQDRAQAMAAQGLFLLADGMGGYADGHLAAELAIDLVAQALLQTPPTEGALRQAITQAHTTITTQAQERQNRMGTTLVALCLNGPALLGAHVGDSRLYRLRRGQLEQLTRDHSYVQLLMDQGEITADQATAHPYRHVLSKALGAGGGDQPDVFEDTAQAEDRYLLCSDGLSGVVSPQEMTALLQEHPHSQDAATALVQKALANNTTDNVTVVVVDVLGEDALTRV